MKTNLFRLLGALAMLALSLAVSGCSPDFYLSESEAAAYSNLFHRETDANNFISTSLPYQVLDVEFDNTSQPPTIRTTNLVTLMRNYTTLGLVEGFNQQVQLDRLNSELQTQMESWIRGQLQLYTGSNNAGARLSQLTSVRVTFLDRPTFTFHPERQSISFSLNVRLTINGIIVVDALDFVSNLIFGVNGTYPLSVDISSLSLNGEAAFVSNWNDASRIIFSLTPQPGTVTVTDTGTSSAPKVVKNGISDTVRHQLSQPLNQSFTQRYNYFDVSGLRLTTATAQTSSTLTYSYQSQPEIAKPMLHTVARGADGKLYHMRKTEGGQSVIGPVQPFPSLTTSIQSEPALYASAPDKLELAATDVSGDLVYAQWSDETWINQTTFAPAASGYTGKPAIVASAPGQVEIIAVGRNGGLWHFRRRNGVWLAPVQVPLTAFSSFVATPLRDPAAVVAGTKVCVTFVDAQNRFRAILFDLESGYWGWPLSFSTHESIAFAPVEAATSDGHVDVVYIGQSGTPYHVGFEIDALSFPRPAYAIGIHFGAEENIGGTVNESPALVSSNYQQLELIARGTDNHLYYNVFRGVSYPNVFIDGRTISTGWQGWVGLNGNFSGSLTFENMTGFSAASTRTGKVELASIIQPSLLDTQSDQYLFQNSFDSERYGYAPWKTVQWRGYEQVGQQRFLGQPALAVTDRHAALVYMDNNLTPQQGRLAGSYSTTFGAASGVGIQSILRPPVDPVVVAPAPGYVDALIVGTDGQIHYTRHSNSRGNLITATLSPGPNITISAPPAVAGYGEGQLEVVAVADNHMLYHWRLIAGTWRGPYQLSGTVISQPILSYLGDGQTLLLAIGTDAHLYYSALINGSWSGFSLVPTSFLVSAVKFGPLAASSWGDGCLDLAVIDAQSGALYHGRIGPQYFTPGLNLDLTPSRPFVSLGGNVTDTPILTAFSPTRLHLLAIGTDSIVYNAWASFDYSHPWVVQNVAPPIVWSGYNYLGGYGLLMGGVAKSGPNEMTMVGSDLSGQVMISRYTGARWTQFENVLGQPAGTRLSPPLFRPAIASFNN